jgi:hypothetical protein
LRSFIIRTPPLDEIKEDEMIGASSACEESWEMCAKLWSENLKGSGHLEDPSVNGW